MKQLFLVHVGRGAFQNFKGVDINEVKQIYRSHMPHRFLRR